MSDEGLIHLSGLRCLEELSVVDTKISGPAVTRFRRDHPAVEVTTEPAPKGTINPFTGKPM